MNPANSLPPPDIPVSSDLSPDTQTHIGTMSEAEIISSRPHRRMHELIMNLRKDLSEATADSAQTESEDTTGSDATQSGDAA